jgi:hypothetical protein
MHPINPLGDVPLTVAKRIPQQGCQVLPRHDRSAFSVRFPEVLYMPQDKKVNWLYFALVVRNDEQLSS